MSKELTEHGQEGRLHAIAEELRGITARLTEVPTPPLPTDVVHRLTELAAELDPPQVEACNWCPSVGPLVKHHPHGQVGHVP